MFIRNHNIILFFLLFGIANINLMAQQKVHVETKDEQNQVKYAGTFDFIINSKHLVAKNGDNYRVIFQDEGKDRVIYLLINNLNWSKGDGDLVIKKSWIGDEAKIFKPLNACIPIQAGANSTMDINVLKNGTTTLRIAYAIVPHNTSCRTAKLTALNKGSFDIKFKIEGIPDTPNRKKTKEETLWASCVDEPSSIDCLKSYLKQFPNGQFSGKAKNRLNFEASQHRFPEIIKLIKRGEEQQVEKACEDFLTLFPSFVDPYSKVQNILDRAKNGTLFEDNQELDLDKYNEVGKTKNESELDINPIADKDSEAQSSQNGPGSTVKEKSPDQLAWENAVSNHNCEGFIDYLNNKTNTKHRIEAEKEVARKCKIKVGKKSEKRNSYSFTIHNVVSLDIDSIVPMIDSDTWTIKKGTDLCTRELFINFPDERNYVVYFSDHKYKNNIRTDSIPIGNLLNPMVTLNGDSILFTFNKGTPPFNIYFRQKSGVIPFETSTNEKVLLLSKVFLKDEKHLSGQYDILVSDKVLNAPYTEEGWTIDIVQDLELVKYMIPIGCIVLTFLFFAYRFFRNEKREKKKNELETFMKSRQKSLATLHNKKIEDTSWKSPEQLRIKNKTSYSADENTISVVNESKEANKIRITGYRKSSRKVFVYNDDAELLPLIKKSVFCFEPHLHFTNSIIESIYFTKRSILKLDHFLVTQNLKPLHEKEGAIPEIGGILVGRPNLSSKDGKYRVIVEEFVPINAKFHSVIQLEFSTESLVKDLGDIQDQYSEYIAVGWFHTHPGHGLFLSKPDLTIQERFFGEPYQFAMEIDSLTERLDTAFFTRTNDGLINNANDKLENSEWYSWLENVESLDQ